MNEESIIKILKKRKPSGKDLGRLSFFIDMLSTCARRQGKEFQSVKMMQEYLRRHLQNLDQEQAEIYLDFSGLFNVVHTYNYLGQGYYQQVLRCFYRIMLIIGNPPIFIGIKSMEEEFDVENLRGDIKGFVTALKRAFAIDQFFKDVEKRFDLNGLVEVYGVSDTLEECVQAYNDVVQRIKELPEYSKVLSYLPYISVDECFPDENSIKSARKHFRGINVFRDKVISPEFYDAYIPEE